MRAVGSSTVYPFAKIVAERIARANPRLGTPIIESTGTGAGMKLFCAGVGERFPDVENASRRMKASEAKLCAPMASPQITEIQVGIDGISLRHGQKHADRRIVTTRDIYHGARQDAVRQAQPRQDLARRQCQAAAISRSAFTARRRPAARATRSAN